MTWSTDLEHLKKEAKVDSKKMEKDIHSKKDKN